jgi:hypothetical protein
VNAGKKKELPQASFEEVTIPVHVKMVKVCPECKKNKKEKKNSQISIQGVSSTFLGNLDFYDNNGKYHRHNPNEYVTYYACSNGHKWAEKYRYSCWCGWPENLKKKEDKKK